MKKAISVLTFSTILLFAVSAMAQTRVVVIPMGGKKPVGDAVAADVLKGKTFSNADTIGMVGVRPPVPVAKTGQTSAVPLDVTTIDGADGQLGKGVAWPNPRFTDNGDGTVTDNLTGLVWLQNANCASGTKSWTEALAFAHALYDGWTGDGSGGDCDLTDGSTVTQWRLPNVLELQSLIAWQYSSPALSNDAGDGKWTSGAGSAFTSVQSNYYWSSTTYADITNFAWAVSLSYGNDSSDFKTSSLYVWPVRD